MIGRIEATIADPDEKQRLAQPSPMTDTPADWVSGAVPAMENERNWLRHPELRAWLLCRLNAFGNTLMLEPPDEEATANRQRVSASGKAALENLQRLAAGLTPNGADTGTATRCERLGMHRSALALIFDLPG